ncbi:MAG TPA: GNAT family N-acetyltransferase [Gaiellaceae bacterium]|nr:GNAT family N-acetyltransferase [Gaiellaceae bacterium]
MIEVRRAETDADLEAWARVKRAVLPNESAWTPEQFRERAKPDRIVLVAELEGEVVGAGLAGNSDVQGRGFVAPRVHPDARRRGVGTALLHELAAHVVGLGFDRAGASVDDEGSRAFAERFGFEEIDREVEQVIFLPSKLPEAPLPDGIEVVSVEERPELLPEAFPLARDEGYADLALDGVVSYGLEDWLQEDASLPGGSFVALANGRIVGYSGLMRHDNPGVAEDGLTVVARDWRRRGLAIALKRLELEWAAESGITEVLTWTGR